MAGGLTEASCLAGFCRMSMLDNHQPMAESADLSVLAGRGAHLSEHNRTAGKIAVLTSDSTAAPLCAVMVLFFLEQKEKLVVCTRL